MIGMASNIGCFVGRRNTVRVSSRKDVVRLILAEAIYNIPF